MGELLHHDFDVELFHQFGNIYKGIGHRLGFGQPPDQPQGCSIALIGFGVFAALRRPFRRQLKPVHAVAVAFLAIAKPAERLRAVIRAILQDNAFKALHSWFCHFVGILRLVHLIDDKSEINCAHVGGAVFPRKCHVFGFRPMVGAFESQRIAFVDFGVAAIRRPVYRQFEPIHRIGKGVVALIIPCQSLSARRRVVSCHTHTKTFKAILGNVQRRIGFVEFIIHDINVKTADIRAALDGSVSNRLRLFKPTHVLQRKSIAFDGFFGDESSVFRRFRPIDCGHEPVCRVGPSLAVVMIPCKRLTAVRVCVQRHEIPKLLDISLRNRRQRRGFCQLFHCNADVNPAQRFGFIAPFVGEFFSARGVPGIAQAQGMAFGKFAVSRQLAAFGNFQP